eukprot:6474737-Amphidinium_carterae.4
MPWLARKKHAVLTVSSGLLKCRQSLQANINVARDDGMHACSDMSANDKEEYERQCGVCWPCLAAVPERWIAPISGPIDPRTGLVVKT